MGRKSNKKRNMLTLNLGGHDVQVTESPDLYTDLGAAVFFGVLARKAKDERNDEGSLYVGAAMAEFADRCMKRIKSGDGMEDLQRAAWVHVLQWVLSALDIENLAPESQPSAAAKLLARLRTGGKS